MATKVIMPQLGEFVVEGTVTTWLKKEGETIAEYESLLEVNTDKVDTEIPASAGGTLLKILVPEGTTVRAGTVLAWIGQPGEAIPAGESAEPPVGETTVPQPAQEPAGGAAEPPLSKPAVAPIIPAPPPVEPIETQPVAAERDLGFISPVVARLAKDKQVDLNQVQGTGQGGRITKKDVLDYLESGPKTEPVAAAASPWETPGEGDLFRPTEMMFSSGKPPAVTPAEVRQAGTPEPVAGQHRRRRYPRRSRGRLKVASFLTPPCASALLSTWC